MVYIAPKIVYVPIEGYRHMYRSLMRYFNLDRQGAAKLLYSLYMGNIDTCTYFDIPIPEVELSRDAFYSLAEPYARPYHTELQMCRSMLSLQRNIQREATIQETRTASRKFTGTDWLAMALICFVLPAVLTWLIGLGCRRIGWIKEGNLKLD